MKGRKLALSATAGALVLGFSPELWIPSHAHVPQAEHHMGMAKKFSDSNYHRYIITIREGLNTTTREFATKISQLSAFSSYVRVTNVFEETKGIVLDISYSQSDKVLAALRQIPQIQYVEQDRLLQVEERQDNAPWGLDRVDQRMPLLDGVYNYDLSGRGVIVYLLDTGIRITHHEFGGHASVAYDAVDDDDDPGTSSTADRKGDLDGLDCNGHGTHVAGIVGGKTYGVAKNATLQSVRVIGRNDSGNIVGAGCAGFGRLSEIIDGINWVTATHRKINTPSIVNLSIGGAYDISFNLAVERSVATGLVYVVAAGNESSNLADNSPASAEGVLPVGASEVRGNSDYRWALSNYGSGIVFAPGVAITSAGCYDDDDWEIKEGTSMAAPHVAGVAAQYLELHPSAKVPSVIKAITDNATSGNILNPGPGSPNLLVYSGFQ